MLTSNSLSMFVVRIDWCLECRRWHISRYFPDHKPAVLVTSTHHDSVMINLMLRQIERILSMM